MPRNGNWSCMYARIATARAGSRAAPNASRSRSSRVLARSIVTGSHRYGGEVAGRPAAGGGRWVEVDPSRLSRWLAGFAERHGSYAVDAGPDALRVRAFDGTVAELYAPPGAAVAADLPEFLAAAGAGRRLGLLLARRGGVAV